MRSDNTPVRPALQSASLFSRRISQSRRLKGGIGTNGNEVRFALPTGSSGAVESSALTESQVSTGIGDLNNRIASPLDQMVLPSSVIPQRCVTAGFAPSGTPESAVQFTVTAQTVLALAISGSRIYAGGNFPSIHGIARQNIAGINISDGTPTNFDPQASDPLTGGGVMALAVSGSTVYAAGFFSMIGGQTRNLVAGLNAVDGSATDFNPNGAPGFGAFALAVASDGTLYAGGSFDTFDLAYQQGFAQFSPTLKLASVVSRKTHGSAGTFDINLPSDGSGIECRTGGVNGDYTLVFSFINNVTSCGVASTGSPSSGPNANQCTVSLTGVANAQTIGVTLADVSDGTNTSSVQTTMGVLVGDTTADRSVNSADISQTKSQSGNLLTGSNFREDINTDGSLNSADISFVKSKSGTALP